MHSEVKTNILRRIHDTRVPHEGVFQKPYKHKPPNTEIRVCVSVCECICVPALYALC